MYVIIWHKQLLCSFPFKKLNSSRCDLPINRQPLCEICPGYMVFCYHRSVRLNKGRPVIKKWHIIPPNEQIAGICLKVGSIILINMNKIHPLLWSVESWIAMGWHIIMKDLRKYGESTHCHISLMMYSKHGSYRSNDNINTNPLHHIDTCRALWYVSRTETGRQTAWQMALISCGIR